MSTAPAIGSPEWASKVTASKVAAILGLSPWESPYSMWLKMKGLIPSDDGNNAAAKSRGHYLEDGICRWWIDQHPDADVEGTQVNTTRGMWAAATPDVVATLTDTSERVVMDAKTAANGDEWGETPPPYYLAQSVWQMWCADADAAYVAALLGPRLQLKEYRIERDRDLEDAIVARCLAFHRSLASDTPPDLDDHVATYEAIRSQHPDIDRDLSVEIDRATAHEYVTADLAMKAAETRARAAKSALLAAMGSARLSTCDGATVARRQPNRDAVTLVRVAKHIDPPTEGEAS